MPSNEPACNCIQFPLCFSFDLIKLSLVKLLLFQSHPFVTPRLPSGAQICAASVPRWAKFAQHLAEHIGSGIFTQIVSKTSDTVGSRDSDHKQSPCHLHSHDSDLKFTSRSWAAPFASRAAPGALGLALKHPRTGGEIREAGPLAPVSCFIHIPWIIFPLFFSTSF